MALTILFLLAGYMGADVEKQAADFIDEHLAAVRPLELRANLAWWHANTTGNEADFKAKEESQNALDALLAQPAKFAKLKAIHSAKISNPAIARQIQLLFLQYQE